MTTAPATGEKYIRYSNRLMPMGGMTMDEAKKMMARHFAELGENPKVEKKDENGKTVYVFSKQAGKKGAKTAQKNSPVARIRAQLAALEPAPVIPADALSFLTTSAVTVDSAIDPLQVADDLDREAVLISAARRVLAETTVELASQSVTLL